MKNKFIILLFFAMCGFYFGQSTIVFRYDEAGNQIFRGVDIRRLAEEQQGDYLTTWRSSSAEQTDESKFWSMVQVYPVPVKDELTIGWSDEADEMIDHVTLYQHNTVANVFTKKNLPNLNRKVQVNMNGMYMGVYILSFQLKDGRKMSRNIIKL